MEDQDILQVLERTRMSTGGGGGLGYNPISWWNRWFWYRNRSLSNRFIRNWQKQPVVLISFTATKTVHVFTSSGTFGVQTSGSPK